MKYKYIESKLGTMGARACLKGTRIPMDTILACGLHQCVEQFLKDYPDYSKEQVTAAVDEVARNIDRWVQNDVRNYQNTHWFVTAIRSGRRPEDEDIETWVESRTFGFLPTYEMAEDAVLANRGDIHEGTYNWVVIEEISWGTLAMSSGEHAEQWYVWNDVYKKYHQAYKPKWAEGVINWALG